MVLKLRLMDWNLSWAVWTMSFNTVSIGQNDWPSFSIMANEQRECKQSESEKWRSGYSVAPGYSISWSRNIMTCIAKGKCPSTYLSYLSSEWQVEYPLSASTRSTCLGMVAQICGLFSHSERYSYDQMTMRLCRFVMAIPRGSLVSPSYTSIKSLAAMCMWNIDWWPCLSLSTSCVAGVWGFRPDCKLNSKIWHMAKWLWWRMWVQYGTSE